LVSGSRAFVKTPDISKEFTSDGNLTSMRLPVGENAFSQGVWYAMISIFDNNGQPEAGEVVKVVWENSD
jgi:hypothetical protein